MMIFSVNVNNNIFERRELKDNVCYRFSLQIYKWKLPHVYSSLNRCIVFKWNCYVLCFFKMKTRRVQKDFENVFFSIPNPARCKTFISKSDAFWKFQFKIMLFGKAPKMQNMSFSRSKIIQKVTFCMQNFFKTWHVEIFLIQNLTRCIFFSPKSDALLNLQIKLWRVLKFFFKI